MAFAPVPSTEETVRLYQTNELAREIARYHETASEEDVFIKQCIELHNKGDINLLAVVSTPAFATIRGHDFFSAQHFYCEAIPKLQAEAQSLMACCNTLISQAGNDLAATQPNAAFQQWCTANPEQARSVIGQAQDGDELARKFVTFAIRSLNDANTAIALIKSFNDDRRVSGMTALAGMRYTDNAEAHKVITILGRFVVSGGEDDVRSNALLATFEILKLYPSMSVARALVESATKEAGPATLYGLAQIVWRHHKQLDSATVGLALQALRSVPLENPGTINILDIGLNGLLGTAHESLALDCLTEMLRDGSIALTNFDTIAHTLSRDNAQRLYTLVMRWLLSGSLALCNNVSKLVGSGRDRPFDTTAAMLNLTPIQDIFVCRKAIGYLFIKPVACCSIIVSVLRVANPESVTLITELLFDPILLNYGGNAKNYLKSIPATDAAYPAIQAALSKDQVFHAELDAMGTIKELHPSDYQRDVVRQRMQDEMQEAHKHAESKSVLMNLVHRSTILYGKRSLTYFTEPGGDQKSVAMDLKSFETSIELPRHAILDPVSLDYMLRVFRVEELK